MEKFNVPSKTNQILMVLAGIGVVTLVAGFFIQPHRAWAGLLVMAWSILIMALFGGFFVSFNFLAGSVWNVVIRRVPESMLNLLPIAAVLVAVIGVGIHELYEWSHEEILANDPILQTKAKYFLNTKMFAIILGLAFVLWGAFGFAIKKLSIENDEKRDRAVRTKMVILSAGFMLSFAYFLAMASIYLLMSLEPHWQTTMFVLYTFSGLANTGFAVLAILLYFIKKNGGLPSVNAEHFHDVGKWLFASTAFWAYITFSQHMLTWYANLPEETIYLENRLDNPTWVWFTFLLWFGHFIVPFFILLSSKIKRAPEKLARVAWLIVVMGFLDIIWMVYGGLHDTLEHVHHPAIHGLPVSWMELGIFAGVIGIVGYVVLNTFAKVNQEPIGDPFYEDSQKFHQSH